MKLVVKREPFTAALSAASAVVPVRGMRPSLKNALLIGDAEGNLLALDSRNGTLKWRYQMGASMHGTSPTTYMVDGRQQILVPAGTTLTAWALPR